MAKVLFEAVFLQGFMKNEGFAPSQTFVHTIAVLRTDL